MTRCKTPRCRRPSKCHSPYCARCNHRNWKANDLASYTYSKLKQSARRRGHPFTLTLEYFRQLCEETGYLAAKGRMKDCLSVDRIDPSRGYSDDNVRVVSVSMNARLKHAPLPGYLREQLEKELSSAQHPAT